ncbi:ATP-binding protein [Arcobacter sp. FWKO B]|uniref:ATP-binding protein n=1 Tax=Arcobacter sp. FWKO B TaxID=2593672 RepID=UPI0018A47E2E|nr:ATP-binding protein [Arcobacter sp. FWKO B]QOG12271.1 DUF3365 domain-containing protein [Arcobacter sp. FWKO B]
MIKIKNFTQSKLILPVVIVAVFIIVFLFVFIPRITEQNLIDASIRHAKVDVQKILLTREYYTKSIVGDIKNFAPQIEFSYDHFGINGKIPFPTTTVHDLSQIFTQNDEIGMIFRFYSDYPFKNRADRVLDDFQKEALYFVEQNDYGIYYKRDVIDNKEVLRVAVADFMTDQACVDCHNSSNLKAWDQTLVWKLGDKRGVIEIIMPLDEELAANKEMRNKILIFIAVSLGLLITYYSYMIIKREKELLDINHILEERVSSEVENSLKKERLLIQQNKTSTMGEMMSAIVHQWKQPLNVISIANSSLQLDLMMNNINKENLERQTDNIEQQIEHMNNTMNDFRSFFKPSQKAEYDIKKVVDDVFHLIGAVYKSNGINLISDIQDDCKTSGYPNELTQVFINILNNARDVIIESKPYICNIVIEAKKVENKIVIKIKDFAGGIPEEIIEKIFEPYFTTKPDDKGTGIGLDMSKVIIEKVGGKIYALNENHTIDGKIFKGATFVIELNTIS